MLLAKLFTVPVDPVQKPGEMVTTEKPFFQPEGGTSKTSTGAVTQPAEFFTSASPVQDTWDVAASMTAIQPVDAPGKKRGIAASMAATRPVEAPGMMRVATQSVVATVQGWPPSMLRLPVPDLKFTLSPPVPVV